MAKPVLKTENEILQDMIVQFFGQDYVKATDIHQSSAIFSLLESMSQAVFESTGSALNILKMSNIEHLSGEDLKKRAAESNVSIVPSKPATGFVDITDTSFTKKSSQIYLGTPSPNLGSTSINLINADGWPDTGKIYIGRGTNNIEGPLNYSSIIETGTYYTINLIDPTTKFHNTGEDTTLGQGGTRVIDANTKIRTSESVSSDSLEYYITKKQLILDGEDSVLNVPITASVSGVGSNVPANSIKQFISDPFLGSACTNDLPLSNGLEELTDAEIRNAIKRADNSRGLGTSTAIKNKTINITAEDDNATVTSNDLISNSDRTTLYIDNGNAYEETSQGVGVEYIVDSALGGEKMFQLATGGKQSSIPQAAVVSGFSEPFDISGYKTLAIYVGDELSEHIFQPEDFKNPKSATAFELISSINSNHSLKWQAKTADSRKKIRIEAKADEDESKIQASSGSTSNSVFNFPTNIVYTLRLYKNNKLLSQKGSSAFLYSYNQSEWSTDISDGDTLKIKCDNTQEITYSFTNEDFLELGGISSSIPLSEWVKVMNTKLIGMTAEEVQEESGNKIKITSNLGQNNRAKVEITGGILVARNMFAISEYVGSESEYTMSRNTSQLTLAAALEKGDSLTAGSEKTAAFIASNPILGGTFSLTGGKTAQLWLSVDSSEVVEISTSVQNETTLETKVVGNKIRFVSSVENSFSNVLVGDKLILWSEEVLNRGEWKISNIGTESLNNDYIEVEPTSIELATIVDHTIVYVSGLIVVRHTGIIQRIDIPGNTYGVDQIGDMIEAQVKGIAVEIINDEEIFIYSKNQVKNIGSVQLIEFNNNAKNLNFSKKYDLSDDSLFANVLNDEFNNMPSFFHSKITSESEGIPTNLLISESATSNINNSSSLVYLNRYNNVDDAELSFSTQIAKASGTSLELRSNQSVLRVRTDERSVFLDNFNFGPSDKLSLIIDQDNVNKLFSLNFYRNIITNTEMSVVDKSFRAYDYDYGDTAEFTDSFGETFSFNEYKALMKPKGVFHPERELVDEDAFMIEAVRWGNSQVRLAIVYPSVSGAEIGHSIISGDTIDINIGLKSSDTRSTSIDATTEWNVATTPNGDGYTEDVSYTYNGVGTTPALGSVTAGDYINITEGSELDPSNLGVYRVKSSTSDSFTVERKLGDGTDQSNVGTFVNGVFSFYQPSDTTAQEIVDYINTNISYLDATILTDGDVTGAGVIKYSSDDNSKYGQERAKWVDLYDGENYIYNTTLGALGVSPQFAFKNDIQFKNIIINGLTVWNFSNSQIIRLVPTIPSHIVEFFNQLFVSSVSSATNIQQLASDFINLGTLELGGTGGVQIIGGSANGDINYVRGSSIVTEDNNTSNIIDDDNNSYLPGQIVKLEAQNIQKRNIGLTVSTNVDVTPNSPIVGQSTVVFKNRNASDRFLGERRQLVDVHNKRVTVEKQGKLWAFVWDKDTELAGLTNNIDLLGKTVNMIAHPEIANSWNISLVDSGDTFMQVCIGDEITLSGFANANNVGDFIINGVSNDNKSIVISNKNGVEELSVAIDLYISSEVQEGDWVYISNIDGLNNGEYRIIRLDNHKNGFYIENESRGLSQETVVNDTGISIAGDTSTQWDITRVGDQNAKITWNGLGDTPNLENIEVGDWIYLDSSYSANNQGKYTIINIGSDFIDYLNPLAEDESDIVTGITITRPSFKFYHYDTVQKDDTLIIEGDVVGDNNGEWKIINIIDKYTVVVSGSMGEAVTDQNLGDNYTNIYINEKIKYTGYKTIKVIDSYNNNTDLSYIVFDGTKNINKITAAAEITIIPQNKLGYLEQNVLGQYSYSYHTGLMRKVNRTMYGDPRDSISYPGVAAAGAEIYTSTPLLKKIQISINVRLNTGIPFAKIVDQVKNALYSLINANPIGQSIAISSLISEVDLINGVKAISITSPSYSPSNDMIVINPSEKSFILDLNTDILVSKTDG